MLKTHAFQEKDENTWLIRSCQIDVCHMPDTSRMKVHSKTMYNLYRKEYSYASISSGFTA